MDMKAAHTPPAGLRLHAETLERIARCGRFEDELAAARRAARDPDDYFQLLPCLSGLTALRVLEAVDDDIVQALAIISVTLAKRFMLPRIAEGHPLAAFAARLVESYQDFAVDGGDAVDYALAAWDFRFGCDSDRELGYLSLALPSHGVDEEIGRGPRPWEHWTHFANWLLQNDPAGRAIDALWDGLIDAEPEGGDDDDDDNWWMDVCIKHLDTRQAALLKPYDEEVRRIIHDALDETLYR